MGDEPVYIAGDQLEGGGQILRISSALSCLLRKPVRVNKIRANRSKPGLRPQHLAGLQFLAGITHARKEGLTENSREITLRPQQRPDPRTYEVDTHTAGSVVLLLQAALPVLLFARGPCRLILRGGTNADMAPPVDYIQKVFCPVASRMGVDVTCNVVRRGFYPKGGEEVSVDVSPCQFIRPLTLDQRDHVTSIQISAFTAGVLPIKVAKAMVAHSETTLRSSECAGPSVRYSSDVSRDEAARGTGCGVVVAAQTVNGCLYGASGVGQKGRRSEDVAQGACNQLCKDLWEGGCVDEYLQDQLIIFMALAKGVSRVRCGTISLHTQTAIVVTETMCEARFQVTACEDGTNVIECQGIGLENGR